MFSSLLPIGTSRILAGYYVVCRTAVHGGTTWVPSKTCPRNARSPLPPFERVIRAQTPLPVDLRAPWGLRPPPWPAPFAAAGVAAVGGVGRRWGALRRVASAPAPPAAAPRHLRALLGGGGAPSPSAKAWGAHFPASTAATCRCRRCTVFRPRRTGGNAQTCATQPQRPIFPTRGPAPACLGPAASCVSTEASAPVATPCVVSAPRGASAACTASPFSPVRTRKSFLSRGGGRTACNSIGWSRSRRLCTVGVLPSWVRATRGRPLIYADSFFPFSLDTPPRSGTSARGIVGGHQRSFRPPFFFWDSRTKFPPVYK